MAPPPTLKSDTAKVGVAGPNCNNPTAPHPRSDTTMKYASALAACCVCVALALDACAQATATPPTSVADAFRATPSSPAALQLARSSTTGITEFRTLLLLPEPAPALIAWAIHQYPRAELRKELEGLLFSADQVAAYWAAKALGSIASPASIPALANQFPEGARDFWEVSGGARNARWREYYFHYVRNDSGRRVRRPARAPVGTPNIRVAYAALEALGQIGGDEARKILIRELGRDHYLIRQGAARALGRMRCAEAEEQLLRMAADDPVLIVRQAAEQAARRLAGKLKPETTPAPNLPSAVVFVKTKERTESNFGYRDSYPYPRLPWYGWGQDLYSLTPPRPDGKLRNLTNLASGAVQAPEVSYDGARILFAMRRDLGTDGFHIYEMSVDGTGLRQITGGDCNDVDPQYLPDGRIIFCSDRAGYREYYHQERSRVLYTMNADGTDIQQISFNPNADFEPIVLPDGRILYGSYRFYGWDGGPSAVPKHDPRKGISRIETVLHTVMPDGSQEQLFYGSMRGGFYSTLRPMPYANQYQTTAWPRTDQMMGVSVSFPRCLPNGQIVCVTPAGLTVLDPGANPMDCEKPIFPEVLNLAGGEEVYIHSFDDQNPVGRYTAPYPLDNRWVLLAHAPWHDLRVNGYGLYLFDLKTRQKRLVYDDPTMSDVDPVAVRPRLRPRIIPPLRRPSNPHTGFVFCSSVFNSDLPFERSKVASVRVLEAVQVGMSLNGNLGFQTRILGTVPIAEDGSFHVEVPADTAFRFALLDRAGQVVVHETEFQYVRPGERKSCVGCHERKGVAGLNLKAQALHQPPFRALRKRGDVVYGGRLNKTYNVVVRE
jgi:hypothetical protein